MLRLVLLVCLAITSCATKPESSRKNPTAKSVDWHRLWVQNGCTLYNFAREAKSFPGDFCIFLDDGSFISASNSSMKRISANSEVLWEITGNFHHQVNLSADANRIFTLSSEIRNEKNKKIRDDVLLILDINGKTIQKKRVTDFFSELGLNSLGWSESPNIKFLKADFETSHLNSFYEIPENTYSDSVPWMKKGNFIINGYFHGIFILSPDLKIGLHHMDYPHSVKNGLHDVQVTPDGSLLLFNNWAADRDFRYSAVDKYDPIKKKLVWRFTSSPLEMFYSPACGGVQEVGELIFFSHLTAGGYLWSPKENRMIKFIPGTKIDPRGVEPTQQLKMVDVTEFLKNNKN